MKGKPAMKGKGFRHLVITRERLKELWKVERSIGFRFKNRHLLDQALTHRSFAHEQGGKKVGDYERLEFIGDAVLDLAVGDLLFREYPREGEGRLTRARADLVNQNRLAEVAAQLEIGDAMRLGKGERHSQGSMKPSILAAALEAIIGAMYLDGGYRRTFPAIKRLFKRLVADQEVGMRDARSALQEWTQKHYRMIPDYRLIESEGPGHSRIFRVSVNLGKVRLAEASGPSKKEANRRAAMKALEIVLNKADSKQ